MADKFKVGDVCIVTNAVKYLELVGKEVTIVQQRQMVQIITGEEIFAYGIDIEYDGLKLYPQEHQLKLKTFDGEQKVFDMFESLNITKKRVEELV